MAKEAVGNRVQKLREERGFSASELARLVDVTPTAVWNWEKNGVQPRSEMMATIAKVLGTTVEYLQTGEIDAQSGDSLRTAASIVEDARIEIARVTGFPLDRVSVEVRFSAN